ncbi:uncharacterized protein LOC130552933 [Triplophysa rosa]|uniref:uncharacterized protein LOC130552933 n=1 Tax=Triplophysa rosa TaxID=992332 RepID=UPI002545E979|nr:uncharacterized protein LOC130552933 [Triplophysa rosa]
MVLKCAFPGCPNREKPAEIRQSLLPRSSGEMLSFHNFPLNDGERLTSWLLAVERDVDLPIRYAKQMRVCSEHFSLDDFKPLNGTRRFLKATAVPILKPRVQSGFFKSFTISAETSRNRDKAGGVELKQEEESTDPTSTESLDSVSNAGGRRRILQRMIVKICSVDLIEIRKPTAEEQFEEEDDCEDDDADSVDFCFVKDTDDEDFLPSGLWVSREWLSNVQVLPFSQTIRK